MKVVREVLDIFVERGAPAGHKIVVHGKADEGPGCDPGDVIVVVSEQEHSRFMRKGADLYVEREVSLADALTGFRLVISHLDGRRLIVRSKPGEVLQPQGGTALKAVSGGGMPIHQDPFKFGNLFLILSIRFPQSIDPSFGAHLRQLLGGSLEQDDEVSVNGNAWRSAAVRGGASREGAEQEMAPPEDEEVFAEDIDPLESSKRPKAAGGEAYDEDADGRGGVPCNQQ